MPSDVDVGSSVESSGYVLPSALVSAVSTLLDGDAATDMLPTSLVGRIVVAAATVVVLLFLLVDVREELVAIVQRRFLRQTKSIETARNAPADAANATATAAAVVDDTGLTNAITAPALPLSVPPPSVVVSSPSVTTVLPSVIFPPSPLPSPSSLAPSTDAYAVSDHALCALIRGIQLIKYSRHDSHSMRTIRVEKSDANALVLSWQSGSVLLSDIVDVLDGKHTATFLKPHNNAIANDAATCFSVVTRNRTVDLQTVSTAQRNEYANALRALTNTMRKRPPITSEVVTPTTTAPSTPHRRTLSVASPRPLDAHQQSVLKIMNAAIQRNRNEHANTRSSTT